MGPPALPKTMLCTYAHSPDELHTEDDLVLGPALSGSESLCLALPFSLAGPRTCAFDLDLDFDFCEGQTGKSTADSIEESNATPKQEQHT